MMKNENGRSMVEMLGVLAIIGVLSVAGIAGYSMAMKKYRTNEILNAASQLVILAQAQNGGTGGEANLQDLGYKANQGPAGVTGMTANCDSAGNCVVTGGEGESWDAAADAANGNGFYTLS